MGHGTRLDVNGAFDGAEVEALSRRLPPDWDFGRVLPDVRDRGRVLRLGQSDWHALLRRSGVLVGAIGLAGDPWHSELFGQPCGLACSIVAADPESRDALLDAALPAARDLGWVRLHEWEYVSPEAEAFRPARHEAVELAGCVCLATGVPAVAGNEAPGIREAREPEIDAVARLASECARPYRTSRSEELVSRSRRLDADMARGARAQGYRVLVHEEGGEVTGHVVLQCAGLAYVRLLGVAARWRRRGIGRALLAAALEAARSAGADLVALATEDRNEAALRLFERAGFVKVARMRVLSWRCAGA